MSFAAVMAGGGPALLHLDARRAGSASGEAPPEGAAGVVVLATDHRHPGDGRAEVHLAGPEGRGGEGLRAEKYQGDGGESLHGDLLSGAGILSLSKAPTRADIERYEAEVLKLPQVIFPIRHYFTPGMVAREMLIFKGATLTGAVHKHAHLVSFDGDITVWTEGGMRRLTGHHVLGSLPGAKRAGYAHEDTYCTGYFLNPDDETDIHKLEARYVEDAHRLQRIENTEAPCLESAAR